MVLDIYWIGLLVLVPLVALVAGHKVILRSFRDAKGDEVVTSWDADAAAFRKTFLRVYLVVMGSEWLQGPYMYSLFKDEKALDKQTVATLYVTTYVSAAVSAFVTGYLADKFGRRAACLTYCGMHALASISVMSESIGVLIAGRVLGGICLNLLWTTFESWMVTEYNTRGLTQSSFPLSAMFGIMTKYNCVAAIVFGVLSHCVVLAIGSKTSPFIVGVICDACAALLMLWTWNENRGAAADVNTETHEGFCDGMPDNLPVQKSTTALKDPRIWVLSFASCCFEGTIFIFTFLWPGTLQKAHIKEYPGGDYATPYGVVFANLMAAMVLGAMLFGFLTRMGKPATGHEPLFNIISPTSLLGAALFVSTISFLIAAFSKLELQFFLTFMLLELCNGVYVPSMAYHRGTIVDDSGRALIYGLMNVPLFVFVIAAIYTTSNEVEHRRIIFLLSSVLLLLTTLAVIIGLGVLANRTGFLRVSTRATDDTELAHRECDSDLKGANKAIVEN
ncbi:MFS general substrate transporter [Hypoxylon sp. FL1150]|nr:MFS general substrate transporter [Hypoxylon sp. FL1150]